MTRGEESDKRRRGNGLSTLREVGGGGSAQFFFFFEGLNKGGLS